jgi:hypothetical protein
LLKASSEALRRKTQAELKLFLKKFMFCHSIDLMARKINADIKKQL